MCNTPKYAKLEERTGNVYSLPGFVLHLNIWLLIFLNFVAVFAFQVMVEDSMKGRMWNTLNGRNLMVNMMK